MNVKLLNDRVLIRQAVEANETDSGIVLAPAAAQEVFEGEVLAVGTGVELADGTIRPLEVQVGDVVIFTPNTGTKVKVESEDLLMLKEEDILAVYEG